METIVNDIRKLEKGGVNITVNNQSFNLKGSILAVIGDNLGQHQIGGFNENFHLSGYFCRYCHINRIGNKLNPTKIYFSRNKNSYCHDIHIASITNESSRGVKFDSILNTLNHYHVYNLGLAPRMEHGLLEGIVHCDLALALNKLVKDKITNFEFLNVKLNNLVIENAPKLHLPTLNKSDKLPGTASQNMWLLIVLPFTMRNENVAHMLMFGN